MMQKVYFCEKTCDFFIATEIFINSRKRSRRITFIIKNFVHFQENRIDRIENILIHTMFKSRMFFFFIIAHIVEKNEILSVNRFQLSNERMIVDLLKVDNVIFYVIVDIQRNCYLFIL